MTSTMYPVKSVLAVDDEDPVLLGFKITLNLYGINNVITCSDSRKVMQLISENEISVILLDLFMPHISGDELLSKISEKYPDIPVIIITGSNEVETAVKCMKEGAFDYIVKPVEENHLVSVVKRAIEIRDLKYENSMLRERMHSDRLEHPEAFSAIVTQNPVMLTIFRYIETVAGTSKPVLITGETGVGKELIVQAFLKLGDPETPFVSINVAGLDDDMFSDTLFGHVKGAYTGALETRKGLIEKASGGILFLDEIGDLSENSQIKLLRLLQNNEYLPLGADTVKLSNARIIVSTNRDINALQNAGKYRKDLYYRLNTHHVKVPPLRKRIDDIPLLLNHFIEQSSEELDKKIPSYPKELISLLATYTFPGNIRELESMVFEAVSNHTSRMLSMDVFKSRVLQDQPVHETESQSDSALSLHDETPPVIISGTFPTLKKTCDYLITEALERTHGNQTMAAQLLGISRSTLSKKLKIQ